MRKKILVSVVSVFLLAGVFTVGVFAGTNWLNFTGDTQIEESGSQVEEIMDILRQVDTDRALTQEELDKLKDMNPPGLVNQIEELQDKLAALQDRYDGLQNMNEHQTEYISHLESELERANAKVAEYNSNTTEAVEEAREIADY